MEVRDHFRCQPTHKKTDGFFTVKIAAFLLLFKLWLCLLVYMNLTALPWEIRINSHLDSTVFVWLVRSRCEGWQRKWSLTPLETKMAIEPMLTCPYSLNLGTLDSALLLNTAHGRAKRFWLSCRTTYLQWIFQSVKAVLKCTGKLDSLLLDAVQLCNF